MPTTLDSAHVEQLQALDTVRHELRAMTAAVEADVRDLRVELRELRAIVERSRRAPDGAMFLSALAIAFGSSAFTAADVQRAPSAELRALVGSASRRHVGAWLKRLHARPCQPYRLQFIKRTSEGGLWSLCITR